MQSILLDLADLTDLEVKLPLFVVVGMSYLLRHVHSRKDGRLKWSLPIKLKLG